MSKFMHMLNLKSQIPKHTMCPTKDKRNRQDETDKPVRHKIPIYFPSYRTILSNVKVTHSCPLIDVSFGIH